MVKLILAILGVIVLFVVLAFMVITLYLHPRELIMFVLAPLAVGVLFWISWSIDYLSSLKKKIKQQNTARK